MMLGLRTLKWRCSKLIFVLTFISISFYVAINTWRSRYNNQIELQAVLDTAELLENDRNLKNTLRDKSKNKEQSRIQFDSEMELAYAEKLTGKGSRTQSKTNMYSNKFEERNAGIDVISEPGRYATIQMNSLDDEMNGQDSEILMINEDVDERDENDKGDKNYRINSKKNISKYIANKEWVSALRARTTHEGILRKKNLHWTIEMAGSYSNSLFSPPPGEFPRQRLPQVIIIGVGHCGTRALIEFLKMHPHIVPSDMEIHFFDNITNFAKGYEWYKSQMPLSYSNQITIEKSPSYIWNESAVFEIYKMNKTIKLIIIMKDPVSRLISLKLSHHPEIVENMTKDTNDGNAHVHCDSQALIHGAYVKYLRSWIIKYHPTQIHIIEGRSFVKDPAKEIAKIETFLGVPHLLTQHNFYFNATKGFYCIRPLHLQTIVCMNERKGREHPTLNSAVEARLYDYYRDYNEELFKLLGRRFPWMSKDRHAPSQVET